MGSSPTPSAKWAFDLHFRDSCLVSVSQTNNCPENRCRRSWVFLTRPIRLVFVGRWAPKTGSGGKSVNLLATRGDRAAARAEPEDMDEAVERLTDACTPRLRRRLVVSLPSAGATRSFSPTIGRRLGGKALTPRVRLPVRERVVLPKAALSPPRAVGAHVPYAYAVVLGDEIEGDPGADSLFGKMVFNPFVRPAVLRLQMAGPGKAQCYDRESSRFSLLQA